MRARAVVTIIGSVFLFVVPANGAESAASQPKDLTAILRTMAARQARVKTLDCTWTRETVYPENAFPGLNQVTRITGTYRVVLSKGDLRLEMQQPIWSLVTHRFTPHERVTVLTGKERRLFTPTHGQGSVQKRRREPTLAEPYMAGPILAAYRLAEPAWGLLVQDRARVVRREQVNGHPCVVIEYDKVPGAVLYRYWLAEDMEYCVVRWHGLLHGAPAGPQTMLRYVRDKQIGWRLVSWDAVNFGAGPARPMKNRITQSRVNQPVKPELLNLRFPKGTRVYNDNLRETFVVEDETAKPGSAVGEDPGPSTPASQPGPCCPPDDAAPAEAPQGLRQSPDNTPKQSPPGDSLNSRASGTRAVANELGAE